jgi:hypothetical protein
MACIDTMNIPRGHVDGYVAVNTGPYLSTCPQEKRLKQAAGRGHVDRYLAENNNSDMSTCPRRESVKWHHWTTTI